MSGSNLINQAVCDIRELSYRLPEVACDRCHQPAGSFSTASRVAIDLNLDHPVLLAVTVSVHYCQACHHYFRAQPPFLRPDAIYTNRVVSRAVLSVYQDGMAHRQVANRLARDFWVRPSEKMVRCWCQAYQANLDFETDYQPWEVLKEHRFLLLRRPEHLTAEEQTQVQALLASPVGAQLQVGRACLVDWYLIWKDEAGQRRTPTEAKARYEAWHTNEIFAAVPVLHKVQSQVNPAKFEQLSHFLQHPEWEATNNGAERAGRAFRHRQAPHFNLRSQAAISGMIKVGAYLRKETATMPPIQRLHSCQRGRTKREVEMVGSQAGT